MSDSQIFHDTITRIIDGTKNLFHFFFVIGPSSVSFFSFLFQITGQAHSHKILGHLLPKQRSRGTVTPAMGGRKKSTMKAIIAAILLVWTVGCANPGFIVQPVEDEPSLLVGLASASESSSEAETRYDHPVEWSNADLQAILKRLLIQEGSGLLDSSRGPQTVFSPEDLIHLIPALQKTFNSARPSDWIVFAVWGSAEHTQGLQVTSGGMYLQDQQLHILLANHRERVSSEEDGIHGIRKNPLHALRDVKRSLLFYPTSYVIESGPNWIMSGFGSPVSEIILDYQALLATNRLETPPETEEATLSEIPKTDRVTAPTTDVELSILQEEISTLKEELSRIKQQMKQQPADPSPTDSP
jgi:hypothetical protein